MTTLHFVGDDRYFLGGEVASAADALEGIKGGVPVGDADLEAAVG